MVDAVRRDDRIEWVHVRHEEAGAFAASAQAKLHVGLAACAGTVGPGAIHLLNGLYDAARDHAPVLAITGQVPRRDIGSTYHQEVDLQALFADVAVCNQTIMVPEQASTLAADAVAAAVGRRGVAHLTLPSDLGAVTVPDPPPMAVRPGSMLLPDEDALAAAVGAIARAGRVTILAGEGCRGAEDELLALADRLQAPIVHALRAKDLVDADHPLWVGGLGLLGSRPGVHAVERADLLLVAGSDFPYRDRYPQGIPVVQVDVDPAHIGRRVTVSHPWSATWHRRCRHSDPGPRPGRTGATGRRPPGVGDGGSTSWRPRRRLVDPHPSTPNGLPP